MKSSPAHWWSAPLLATAVALTACGDELDLVVVEGELIDVKHEPELQLCEGTLAAYERGIESAAEQLGLDVRDFEPMTFSWLTAASYADQAPAHRRSTAGYASGAESFGVDPYMFHEVVHMVAYQEKGNAIPFLSEGLATAFDEKSMLTELVDPRPILTASYNTSPTLNYDTAATFVSYLLSRYGPERFWQLNADLRRLSTEAKFRRRFAAIYGRDLDDEVEEYLQGECPEDALPIPLPPSCAADEIPWGSDGSWTYARALDCSDDDVAGGIGGEYPSVHVEHAVTFVIEEAGDYEIRRIGDDDIYALVYPCGGCPWLNSPTFAQSQYLQAGRYSLRLVGFEVAGGSIGVAITPR